MTRPPLAALVGILTAAGVALAGCSGTGSGAATQSVTVLAASSLKDAFTTLGAQFEAAHPGIRVVVSFGASSTLAHQITSGAPADVFASASPKDMKTVLDAGKAEASRPFATNSLAVAVPSANPAHITSLADLAKPGVKVALCQAAAPCGVLAQTVLRRAQLTVTPTTLEADARSVLTKVSLGEVDAGLVYVTDARAAAATVSAVAIPSDVNAVTTYPIAVLTSGPSRDAGRSFADYVLSPAGQGVLAAAGFGAP
jgi:molybdate transport system substrate-binding protein